MGALTKAIESQPTVIVGVLGLVIVFFLAACTFHDAIPVCHWLFGCDHGLH